MGGVVICFIFIYFENLGEITIKILFIDHREIWVF